MIVEANDVVTYFADTQKTVNTFQWSLLVRIFDLQSKYLSRPEPTFTQITENNFCVMSQCHHNYFIGHTNPTQMLIFIEIHHLCLFIIKVL